MSETNFEQWKKDNNILIEEMNQFEDEYRLNNDCTCDKIVYENGKSYCKHLLQARTSKFKEQIKEKLNNLDPILSLFL